MYKEAIENKVNVNKIHLISNPISLAETRKGVRPLRTKGEKIKLIFVGRLVYQKGIDRVLHLFHNQSNLELLLVGNGNEKERLLSKTKKYGNTKNIFFLGERQNPFDLVAGADYFLLPSRWEGMPNCVLESLSLGTPVLAFKQIFSLKDLDKNLYSNNSVSLSENIEELKIKMKSLERRKDYRKPKLRKSLIKNFSSPRIYQEKINNIILNLL